jgi:hypothetical protein
MCAFSLLACGNGDTQQDAGVDASGSGDAASDASTMDVVVTNSECIEAGAACQACCTTLHPDASTIFDNAIGTCACGTCQNACASSFCASQPSTKACDGCISKQCYPNAQTACNADPACKAWLACLVPCP